MGTRMSFNSIVSGSGTRSEGSLPVTTNVNGSPVGIPFAVLNGVKPGPRVWVIAGIHGDEIEGVRAAQRVIREVDPARLKGSVVAILSANPSALAALAYESPEDGKHIGQVFPGSPNGSFTERLAHVLFSSMIEEISEDDAVLALHGGGRAHRAASLIQVRGTGDTLEAASMELARAGCNPNLNIVVRIEERSGPWATIYQGTLGRALHEIRRVRYLVPEAGGATLLALQDVQAHYDCICNVLKTMGMLEGALALPQRRVIYVKDNVRVFPTQRGFWLSQVEAGQRVGANDLIAEVVDIYGNVREELRSPFDGLVLYQRICGVVDPESGRLGDRYGANIGKVFQGC